MKNKKIVCGVAFLLVVIAMPFAIIAQTETEGIAKINKIATFSDGIRKDIKGQTPFAQIQRKDLNKWVNAQRNDNLFFQDILKLEQDVRLRVNVKNKLQNGSISMVQHPDLKQEGRYKVIQSNDGTGRVSIEIMQGSAILQVVKDKIHTTTGGLTSVVESGSTTRALFHMKPDTSGEIFLEQGKLTFPGSSVASSLQAGQVAHFSNGQITKILTPTPQLTADYKDFIKTNNKTVWKPPIWKNPIFLVGAAAVISGTTYLIVKSGPGDKKATGTISVSW